MRSGGGSAPMTESSDRHEMSSSIHGSSRMTCRCTSRMRAVSSALSTYRPIQNNDSAMRLSTGLRFSLLLLLLGLAGPDVWQGAHLNRREPERGGRGGGSHRRAVPLVGEHPRVL